MDALSDVLRVAHLTGGVFLHADFFAPWCMSARVAPEHCAPALGPTSHLILYHYVVEGELHVQIEGEDEEGLIIGPGEVVLLPRNDRHLMGSDLSLPPVAGSDIIRPPLGGGLASIHHGGDGGRTRMICGFLSCASGEGNPVISTLPALLKLNVEQAGAAEWIRSTFRYAAEEVSAGRPGSGTVLAKLSELLFVEAVRRYAETLPDGQTGWLAGLRETHVARALALLHGDLTRCWTVDDLSREVGLSRSALADRFNHEYDFQRTLPAKRTNMSIPVWAALAVATWTIAILMLGVGVYRWSLILAGKAELKSFPGDEPHGSPFYRRAVRAHANCVENLPVFVAIVLAEQAAGVHSPTLDVLSAGLVAARVVQTSAHLTSGSNAAIAVRFTFLCVQLAAFVWMGALVVLHAAR